MISFFFKAINQSFIYFKCDTWRFNRFKIVQRNSTSIICLEIIKTKLSQTFIISSLPFVGLVKLFSINFPYFMRYFFIMNAIATYELTPMSFYLFENEYVEHLLTSNIPN